MEIKGQSIEKAIFPKAPPISLFFVGGCTLHKCYILHIRFGQFLKGNLVGALKLIVLFLISFIKLTLKFGLSLPVLAKFRNYFLFFRI